MSITEDVIRERLKERGVDIEPADIAMLDALFSVLEPGLFERVEELYETSLWWRASCEELVSIMARSNLAHELPRVATSIVQKLGKVLCEHCDHRGKLKAAEAGLMDPICGFCHGTGLMRADANDAVLRCVDEMETP